MITFDEWIKACTKDEEIAKLREELAVIESKHSELVRKVLSFANACALEGDSDTSDSLMKILMNLNEGPELDSGAK